MSERGTQDIPRCWALQRDNTPSPAECGLCVTVQSCSLSCVGEKERKAEAWGALSLYVGVLLLHLLSCSLVHEGLLGIL